MNKPREFWIIEDKNHVSASKWFNAFQTKQRFLRLEEKEQIHVIEYAAYEELQAKLDKAIETLRFVRENFLDIPCEESHEKGMLTTGRIQIKRTLKELEG